jgi:hypothetical protein
MHMAKTATAKTNGHSVSDIKTAPPKTRTVKTAAVAVKSPAKPAAPDAGTAPLKAVAKPAAVAKAAPKAAPQPALQAEKKVEQKAAPKTTPKTAPKTAAKSAPKAAAKTAPKTAVKATAKTTTKATPKAASQTAPKAARTTAPKADTAEGVDKPRKAKLVRDSFTMPEQEYAVLGQVKKACLKAGFDIKKSELLRIGVALISQLDLATLQKVLSSLPQLKTGRPKSM